VAGEQGGELSAAVELSRLFPLMAQVQDTCKKWSQAAATPTLGGVREGCPSWTAEPVRYPFETTCTLCGHRRTHFRMPVNCQSQG
jgi:hypothetical protein